MTILRLSDAKFVEANDASFGGSDSTVTEFGHDSHELDIWLNLEEREKFLAELRRPVRFEMSSAAFAAGEVPSTLFYNRPILLKSTASRIC